MQEAQPSVSDEVPAFAVLRELFAAACRTTACQSAACHLVHIRERSLDQLTALDGGDYDLLLPTAEHADFLRLLLRLAQQHEVSFTLDQTNPAKRRITLHAPEHANDIVLEVWSHLEVRDPEKATARAIVWADLASLVTLTEAGWRLPPTIEVLYYLSHLATRRKSLSSPEVQRRLYHYRNLNTSPEAQALIQQLTSTQNVSSTALAAHRQLVALGVLKPVHGFMARSAAWWTAEAEHRLRQRRRNHTRGGVYAFTGPDGVGKTTVITALCADLLSRAVAYRFKSLFRHNPLYNLVYALRYNREAQAHGGKLEKNVFDELQSLALFRIARLGHPWLKLRAAWGAYRCCDRYYHELLFADLRRSGAQPHLRDTWETLAPKIPLPAWHIQLDAADAVILSRKQELTPSALACYREGLFAIHLAIETPYYTYLNTGTSLDNVRATLRRAGTPLGLRFRP